MPATPEAAVAARSDADDARAGHGADGSARDHGERLIVPTGKRVRLREIFTTWEVAKVLVVRDLQSRYKQSALGPIWLAVQPLAMAGGFTVVFSGVADVQTEGVPYVLFSLVGVTVWLTIQMSVLWGTRTIAANKILVQSVPVPRIALITASILTVVPQFAFTLLLSLLATVALDRGVRLEWLALPALTLWLFLFLLFLILPLASWHARYRDVGSTVPFLFQAALFLSPVAYPLSEAGETLQALLALNPATGLIEAWRWSILGSSPDTLSLALAGAWTLVIAAFGWRTFAKAEVKFADVV
jgi:lipopolysaccharide transport system permease protein